MSNYGRNTDEAGRKISFLLPDDPTILVWERGLDWQQVIDEIEANPGPWDAELEKCRKQMKETALQIETEKGKEAAARWWEEHLDEVIWLLKHGG